MTPEERAILERVSKLAEENNEMLRKIRRTGRWSLIIRVAYWVIVVGLALGVFYFLQPYVDAIQQTYSGIFGQNETTTEPLQSETELLLDLLK